MEREFIKKKGGGIEGGERRKDGEREWEMEAQRDGEREQKKSEMRTQCAWELCVPALGNTYTKVAGLQD